MVSMQRAVRRRAAARRAVRGRQRATPARRRVPRAPPRRAPRLRRPLRAVGPRRLGAGELSGSTWGYLFFNMHFRV